MSKFNGIDLSKVPFFYREVIKILMMDPGLVDLEILDHEGEVTGIGFHTSLPNRSDDDDETWDQYQSRIGDIDPDLGGLSPNTWDLLETLSTPMIITMNDCPGCENEGVVQKKED